MSNEEFYLKSKKTCESINELMGINEVEFRRKDIGILYYTLLRDTLVHIAAEDALDCDERMKNFNILIPFICNLNLKFEDNNIIVESVELDKGFQKQLKKALTTGESDIDKKLCKSVIRRILDNYKDLL